MTNSEQPMPRRRIPVLPERPRVHPIPAEVHRSYSTGRQNFSRTCQGEPLVVTITTDHPIPERIRASLMTTLNSADGVAWTQIPYTRADDRTLACRVTPDHPGLHSFRSEFSRDDGATWLRDTFPDSWVLVDPPQVDALRLYTLIPTVSGTIADWQADLARIRGMNFNAIHLLPVTTMDTSESPYSASDLFTIDPSYLVAGSPDGGMRQLEEFVESARALGLRLCFDLVLNHIGVDSAMACRAPDWIMPDQNQPDGFQRAGYVSGHRWLTWNDLVLINYEHPSEEIRSEIWAYMTDYALFWANYANATGGLVRLDNLHSSHVDFVQSLTVALHDEYPAVGLLAEYFTDDVTLLNTVPAWGLNLVLATPWNYEFAPQLREYLKYIHRISGHIRFFMPVTSHDSQSPAQAFGSADSTVPRYVAAALLGTGSTGMPQGVEFGETEQIDFIGEKPKMAVPAEPRFAAFIGRVNAILADNPVFRQGENCRFVDGDHSAIIAAFRQGSGPSASGCLVACNFDTLSSQRIEIDLAPFLGAEGPFPCCELLSGEARLLPHARLEILLPPCGAQILRFPGTDSCLH